MDVFREYLLESAHPRLFEKLKKDATNKEIDLSEFTLNDAVFLNVEGKDGVVVSYVKVKNRKSFFEFFIYKIVDEEYVTIY